MPGTFIDQNAQPRPETVPSGPGDLPHGLIRPPARVLEIVAKEKARFPAEIFTPEAEEQLTNDLTLQYYFDPHGCDVAYRSTPQGPEVRAVGVEEIATLRKNLSEDEWRNLRTWQH